MHFTYWLDIFIDNTVANCQVKLYIKNPRILLKEQKLLISIDNLNLNIFRINITASPG